MLRAYERCSAQPLDNSCQKIDKSGLADSARDAGSKPLPATGGRLRPRYGLLSRPSIALPILNAAKCLSVTFTWSPVRGLRAMRASRCLTENTPKPRSSTRSPRASAAAISVKSVATMRFASRRPDHNGHEPVVKEQLSCGWQSVKSAGRRLPAGHTGMADVVQNEVPLRQGPFACSTGASPLPRATTAHTSVPSEPLSLFHLAAGCVDFRLDRIIFKSASRVGLTPSPTCLPGQGGSRKGMRPFGNETGRANVSPPRETGGGCRVLSIKAFRATPTS